MQTKPRLPLRELARRVGPRRNGRPTNIATLHRWRTRGCRGVLLHAVLVGGVWCATVEDLDDFIAAVTRAASGTAKRSAPQANEELDSQRW